MILTILGLLLNFAGAIAITFDSANPLYSNAVYAWIKIHNTGDLFEATRGKGVCKIILDWEIIILHKLIKICGYI